MNRARRILSALALTAVALVFSLGLAEVALRLLLPAPTTYRMLLPGTRIFEPDRRYVHGIEGPGRYSVNSQGIRGRDFGRDGTEYRILQVGGSTAECTMLDDDENWGSIAERGLARTSDGRQVWVGNVGRSGLTSRDHVVTLRYLLPQYPKMDLVVVLVGVNDLTAALRQGEAYRSPPPLTNPIAERMQVRNAFALSPGGFREILTSDTTALRDPWYKNSRLYQLARRARTGWQARNVARGLGGENLGQWRSHRQGASRIIDTLPDLTRALADYRQSLEAIVAETRQRGVDLMLLTQPALWKPSVSAAEERTLWLGGTGSFQEEPGHAYYSPRALHEAMARYNAEALSVCRAHGLACLDLAERVPRDTTMFYDDVHFTEAGAAAVGHALATHIRSAQPALFR